MSTDELRVSELRSLVSDLLTPDYDTHFNLLRWIQGHPEEPMEKIAYKLRHHLLFRYKPHYRECAWGQDWLGQQKQAGQPAREYWPSGRCGWSEALPNSLVHVDQAGFTDYAGVTDNFSVYEIRKAKVADFEEMLADVMKMEEQTGEQASVIYVFDAEGIKYDRTLIELTMGPFMSIVEFVQLHYVELIKYFVLVNVTPFMSALWMMAKPLLPIHTLMHPAICPVFWNDSKHSGFKLPMARPPKVPAIEISKPPFRLGKLSVPAGQVHGIPFHLEKGDALSFHIMSKANFGFTIVRAENEDEDDVFAMPVIFPLIWWMHGPLTVPIEDTVVAPESGLYKVWFSNSRAWWYSVNIQHSIKVIKNRLSESE